MKPLIRHRPHLTQEEKQQEYLRGFILKEHREGTLTFIFNGNHYTTTKRRAKKGRLYSFRSHWLYNDTSNSLYKMWLIATKQVHKFILKETK